MDESGHTNLPFSYLALVTLLIPEAPAMKQMKGLERVSFGTSKNDCEDGLKC